MAARRARAARRLLAAARGYLGAPYRRGARWERDRAFDCCGFVAHVFREALGVRLPRALWAQARWGRAVARRHLMPGDLLFFWIPRRGRGRAGHVAIYAGGGRMIHAYRPGLGVTFTDLGRSRWWREHYLFARRVLGYVPRRAKRRAKR